MTVATFRQMALALPEAVEQGHMGHPDFRVKGKIFATLGYPDERWAMVKLTPEQQTAFMESAPQVFVPVQGGWGRKGATNVRLAEATRRALGPALATAWRNVAPRALAESDAGKPAPRKRGKGGGA
ncbi:MAG TPA: MmcQ/YjbR family DNA-binding protein [Vicinamibacteria bacterium]|nr:MmcQ/YjbR family DNA-binding protein [Vicinamibacteria bacterium]